MKKFLLMFMLYSSIALSYKIQSQDIWVGGSLGGSVNVARMTSPEKSPGWGMPLIAHIDYALDNYIGAHGALNMQFSPGAMSLILQGGGRYWFSYFDTPFVPYADLGLSLGTTLTGRGLANHYNFGAYFGGGINYFVMGDFLVGLGVRMTPSIAFAGGQSAFEFSTTGFIDLSFKL